MIPSWSKTLSFSRRTGQVLVPRIRHAEAGGSLTYQCHGIVMITYRMLDAMQRGPLEADGPADGFVSSVLCPLTLEYDEGPDRGEKKLI